MTQHQTRRRPVKRVVAYTALAGLGAATVAVAATASASTATTTVTDSADSYVNSSSASSNYGTATQVRTDGSPTVHAYLKFTVANLPGAVTGATLRIYANSKGSAGVSAYSVASNSWSETGITYSNAPALGTKLASSGAISANSWVTVNVSSLVTGDGTYTIALAGNNSTAESLASREAANKPQLVITTDSSGTPSPTPTPTATATAKPTPTVTATATPTPTATSTASAKPTPTPTVTATATPTPTTSTPPATGGPCGRTAAAPTYNHVLWIIFENHADTQVTSSAAPYFTSLKSQCGYESDSHGVTHPSLPNYLAMTGGSTFGVTDDNPPSSHPISGTSIFSTANAAGKTWKSYQEDMTSNCMASGTGKYAPKHNPAAYYTNIRTTCSTADVPMGTTSSGNFINDINNGTLANFTFVTPNLCNDMHDCSVATGDTWLKNWLPKILAGKNYAAGDTAVFVTFDEDDMTSVNRVYTSVIAPSVTPGKVVSTNVNHYGILRTTLEMLGLPTSVGSAATAPSLKAAFNL